MKQFRTNATISAQRKNLQALHKLFDSVGLRTPEPIELLPIIVFMAFTIEAYINNLGFRHIPEWAEKEREPWRKKIKLLHKHQGKTGDWNVNPLLFATELFKLRELLAHGKPQKVEGPSFDNLAEANNYIIETEIDPEWFTALDHVWYNSARDRFIELMEYLAILHNLSPTDYYHASTIHIIQARR